MSRVCWRRDRFNGHGFRVRTSTGDQEPEYFAFCCALQNPLLLCLSRLRPRARPLASDITLVPTTDASWWRFDFAIDEGRFCFSDRHMPDWSEGRVDVLLSLRFLSGGRVVSDLAPVPLTDYLQGVPPPRRNPQPEGTGGGGSVDRRTQVVSENPWMLCHLEESRSMIKRKNPWVDEPAEQDSEDRLENDEAVELADSIFEQLAQVRATVREQVAAPEHFRIGPLGGSWTMRRLGILSDAYKGWAHGADGGAWCDMFNLAKAARFNVNLYGDEGAAMMARQWTMRMSFLYQAWLGAGSPKNFIYEAEELLGRYTEPPESRGFVSKLSAPQALRRVEQLRAFGLSGSALSLGRIAGSRSLSAAVWSCRASQRSVVVLQRLVRSRSFLEEGGAQRA